ncbi:MAG: LCP family protein [Clostridia bacterium]|nr:LCP family protein [Clostridia bacterium]
MTCKKCGKRIKEGSSVCPRCGAPQTETISLGAINAAHENKKRKKKLTGKQLAIRIVIIAVAALAALVIAGVTVMWAFLEGNIQKGSELSGDLGINDYLPPSEDVQNIALFGLDDRDSSADGHSDAIIILSIDRKHNKIKMTSIGRDTLVPVEGYPSYDGKTKLTHAFSYGGVNLAVKTLNRNFGMNITDYVYVNFREFMDIIDYIGGVTINVENRELRELNNHIYWMEIECKRDIDRVKSAGEQKLTGGQALAYSRIRKIDSDIQRGNRQKDVLQAMFNEVKALSLSKFPGLIKKVLSMCHTNMTSGEMMTLATWALTGSPEIVNYSLPDDNCKAWGGDDGSHGWVWIYDLEYATCLLHDFIYESGMDPNISRTTTYIKKKTTKKTTTATAGVGGTTATTRTDTDPTGGGGTWLPPIDDNPDNTTATDTDWLDPTGTGGELTDPTGTGTGDEPIDPTGGETTPTDLPTGGTEDTSGSTTAPGTLLPGTATDIVG